MKILQKEYEGAWLKIGIISFITLLLSSLFFYIFLYRSLKNNNELFPKRPPARNEYATDQVKERFGITMEDAKKATSPIFIDGREIEEYNEGHILGAIHLRSNDVNYENLKEKSKDKENLFVIYCHDGTRSSAAAEKINRSDVKFLLDSPRILKNKEELEKSSGPAIEKSFQNRDFSVSIDQAIALIKGDALIVDGRFSFEKELPGSLFFRIGNMTSDQYEKDIKSILARKNSQIIYVADTYADLFYAKIFFQRLVNDYSFNINKLSILFNESEDLVNAIK